MYILIASKLIHLDENDNLELTYFSTVRNIKD